MSTAHEVSLAQARNELSRPVATVEATHERVAVTKHGRRAAILISPDDLDSLEETLDIVSAQGVVDGIRQAEADIAAGDVFDEAAIRRDFTGRLASA